jgi:hypothetical protein
MPLLTPTILTQTGLGEVFEDAITPTLMFLPNITPVDESVQLLEPAYHALIVLGQVLYGEEMKDGKTVKAQKGKKEEEMKFWDRVIRKGVLMGYAHASEHPAIVEVLLRNLGVVVEKMGIDAVKHLKVFYANVITQMLAITNMCRTFYPSFRQLSQTPSRPLDLLFYWQQSRPYKASF